MAEYWASLTYKTPEERCKGLVFSILVVLDGGNAGFPALDISLSPHPDDKQFHIDQGDNWFESGMIINDCQLHELYASARYMK
jgi:hypothetical protein